MSLMPNMVTPGGAAANSPAPNMVIFGAAGGRANEGRLQVDGISVGTAFNGAGVSAYPELPADVGRRGPLSTWLRA